MGKGGDGFFWSKENKALVAKLWIEGLSAAAIAKRIGGVTRNAVIGVCHRNGWRRGSSERGRSKMSYATQRLRRAPARPVRQPRQSLMALLPAAFQDTPDVPVTPDRRKLVLDLVADDCRWPIGDPRSESFSFCPDKKVPGHVYCLRHALRATQAPVVRDTAARGTVAAGKILEEA